jgi:metal-responsive CopG/Arc/MetJ family transcriptional regulator
MKTAISIPDDIYKKADRLALLLSKSRSQLYSEAVAEYVLRHDPDAVVESVNKLCDEIGSRPEEFVSAAARRVLKAIEW